jgi:hypothetical protein
MFFVLQIGVTFAMLAYLWQCQANLRQRNRKSWQSLLTELEQCPIEIVTPRARLQRTRIILEIANYAELHGGEVSGHPDRADIATIRRGAMEDRISALIEILRSALFNSRETRPA